MEVDIGKDKLDFSQSKASLEKLIHLVTKRFALDNKYRAQVFDVAANMNINAWDMLKYKFLCKLTARHKGDRKFLMVFGGSSVTAGHDNYFHESYPIFFQRRISEAFRALKVDLVVHNIAQGSNDCYPYNWCYEAMGGEKPDWIGGK